MLELALLVVVLADNAGEILEAVLATVTVIAMVTVVRTSTTFVLSQV